MVPRVSAQPRYRGSWVMRTRRGRTANGRVVRKASLSGEAPQIALRFVVTPTGPVQLVLPLPLPPTPLLLQSRTHVT